MATGSRRNIWWLLLISVVVALLASLLSGAAVAGDGKPAARNELRDAMLATPDPRRGEDLYAPCGACHGVDGRGVDDGSVPAIAALPRGFGAGKGDGEHLDVGARTYFRHCESCHGPLGEGDALRGVPRLAGQHYRYLYRQFFDAVEQRRPNLPPRHVELMAPLDRAQIIGISDYLSRTSLELTRAAD